MRRDIVVIGASAGGISALTELVKGLPAKLKAAIFVVVHSSPTGPGTLPDVLNRVSRVRVGHAVDRERFRHGRIYVAPPDRHLLLLDGTMRVTEGPRENGFRPAVDPLFRTAASEHGSRVVGVILSGALNDGTLGLQKIKQEGGIAVAQHLEDAIMPSMPLSAIRTVEVDHILPAKAIGPLLARLSGRDGKRARGGRKNGRAARDVAVRGTRKLESEGGQKGELSPFTCPECGGALSETHEGKLELFRCHVGHGFTAQALGNGLDDRLEQALWTALRSLEENAAFHQRLADRTHGSGLRALAAQHRRRAAEARDKAATIQAVIAGEPVGKRARAVRRRRR